MKQASEIPNRQDPDRSLANCIAFRGLMSQGHLDAAVEEARSCGRDLEAIVLEKYRLEKSDLGAALSAFYSCPYVPYDERTVMDPDLFKSLSRDYLRSCGWVPLTREGNVLSVIMRNPHDVEHESDIRRVFPGCIIRRAVALRSDIEQFLMMAQRPCKVGAIAKILGDLVNEVDLKVTDDRSVREVDENDSAIVRLASQIITEADRQGASDIHIEPYSD